MSRNGCRSSATLGDAKQCTARTNHTARVPSARPFNTARVRLEWTQTRTCLPPWTPHSSAHTTTRKYNTYTHTHTHHGRNDATSEAHHGIQQERRFWGVGAMQHNETLCDACMPRPVYFRLRSPSSSSSLLPPAASSVAVASSRNFATFLFSSCRARSRGDLPSLSLMSSKDLSYAYNTLAATRLPWKAAQCREFHPSPSTTLGFPPRAITELIASSVSCPPKSPLSTIRGVHLFSVDFWLQFSLLTAFTNFLTSA
mmetsp:Transcript_9646/g.22027  ORF Transcript_9646/g.22027 Transcript_9646/m.22027 type:complete len:256 (+) Transcript_9646:219-986(+)